VVLWAVSNPLAAVAGLAATVGLYGAARRVRAGVRRRLERRTVTVRLGTLVRITIARQPPEDCHPREHCCA